MRPAARIKCGFYPTPLDVVKLLKSWLSLPEQKASILDPCAGEGIALAQLADGQNATTYGVEIDEHRAKQAEERLEHVLHSPIEETRITNGVFSLLFLNPPYDDEIAEAATGKRTERKERVFLRETVRYLQPGGALIYIIPQNRLDQHIIGILAYRFEQIRVYRFPGEMFDAFKQVVVVARKKRLPEAEPITQRALTTTAKTKLPELRRATQPLYVLPPGKPVNLFKSTRIDLGQLEHEANRSVLWERLYDLHQTRNTSLQRPPIPLHKGHLALLLASGSCDGLVGEGEEKHLVKGHIRKTKKITTECEERGEEVVTVTKERDQFNVIVRLLKQDGTLLTLK